MVQVKNEIGAYGKGKKASKAVMETTSITHAKKTTRLKKIKGNLVNIR